MRFSALLAGVVLVGFSFTANAKACDNCIAQQKAQKQASQGRLQHVGGSFGTGRYEGVGFSTRSADEAIRSACYWGQKTPVGIGVAKGAKGYYATVLYKSLRKAVA